jgi:hypothetical protein
MSKVRMERSSAGRSPLRAGAEGAMSEVRTERSSAGRSEFRLLPDPSSGGA